MLQHQDIGLGGIAISGERMRALRASKVSEIAESFKTTGQLQPIVVRPAKKSGFVLIAGHHRLEAARHLKWDTINCIVVDGKNADEQALIEIDENLIRADLSPAETAAHIGARKDIYERLHPETRRGATGIGRKKVSQVATSNPAFIDQTAARSGQHRATVARAAARGKAVPHVGRLANTSLDKGEELDALGELYRSDTVAADALVEQALNGEKVSARTILKKSKRQTREQELGAYQTALPETRYGVIYADPPWTFAPWSPETGMDRSAENHYPVMTTTAIEQLEVPAADDSVLFLWATAPMLLEALDVIDAWGFEYRSQIIWVKDRIGTGYWARNRHEILLIATKGSVPAPAPGDQPESVIEAKVGKHSEKPVIFRAMIEKMFPNLPRLEMFARTNSSGWDAWGNEVI